MPGKEDAGPVAGIFIVIVGIVIPSSELFKYFAGPSGRHSHLYLNFLFNSSRNTQSILEWLVKIILLALVASVLMIS